LTSIGFLLEDRKVGIYTEIARSAAVLLFISTFGYSATTLGKVLLAFFGTSITFWVTYMLVSPLKSTKQKSNEMLDGKKTH